MLISSGSSRIQSLAEKAFAYGKSEGEHNTSVSGLSVHIRNTRSEPIHCLYTLSFSIILQGSKQLLIGNKEVTCIAGQSILTTLDLPVVSHITEASTQHPFVALTLKLDYKDIIQTCAELELEKPARDLKYQSVSVQELDSGLNDAMARLIGLQKEPMLLSNLTPLVKKEIITRLLLGSHGIQLRHIATAGSSSSQLLNTIIWMKNNYSQAVEMSELAEQAQMSVSAFYQRFKALTGTSPLQYMKNLRLQEARDQMLLNGLDANQASGFVGYESPSQFSREYRRLFGLPPYKDILRLRN